jgi:surface antigen
LRIRRSVRRRGRLQLLVVVALAVALTASALLVTSSGAAPRVSATAAKHKHRKPHRQALSGPLSKAKVKVVSVIIRGGKGGAIAAGDDYPAKWRNRPQDSVLDQWREYNRECTSFVAWALYSRNGFNMPFYDNANEWGPDAQRRGYLVNSSPAVGSVAWSNAGKWGHVAYVVAVNGGSITIEEYNEHFNGTYDQRTVAASAFTGYIHFKDPSVTLVQSQNPPAAPQPGPTQTVTQTVTSPAPTTGTTTTPATGGTPPPPPQTWGETAGGVAHTWTNYTNAGGTQGPSIGSGQTVQIACKLTGFRVSDGNTWWYRIASGPWNGAYYVSADAFYNNGQTSGSLVGTPFVDPAVANC